MTLITKDILQVKRRCEEQPERKHGGAMHHPCVQTQGAQDDIGIHAHTLNSETQGSNSVVINLI